jgi:UDP-N-acetylglucosamine enolpyruvyl transferase
MRRFWNNCWDGVSIVEKITIRGGNRLAGDVTLSGGKNTVLKLMAAAVMAQDICVISSAPCVGEITALFKQAIPYGYRHE